MTKQRRQEERRKLMQQIQEWNDNRLDLFELSLPNEELEFHGVMRFFYQDEGSKVATKCIRVSSSASTADVLDTLIVKFRPDMRMLSLPNYSLYEVHVNGEERKLEKHERPLFVQLNWGKDDREGRFLLKSETAKTASLSMMGVQSQTPLKSNASTTDLPAPTFKRKLSKREKKELKKKEKEAKARGSGKENVAEKLYNELPETSFTRSISNPEAVMRRRRQMKLEKKLQQYRSKDGGPDTGGTLKIYGEQLRPDVPYKTLLLSTSDTAAAVVKETLDKYGMDKADPSTYCLIQTILPPGGDREYHGRGQGKEFILDDEDCPLFLLMQHHPAKGFIMFHIRRRPQDLVKAKKKKKDDRQGLDEMSYPGGAVPEDRLPYLINISPEGAELYNARKLRIPTNVTEVGSDQGGHRGGQYIQIEGYGIHPKHCVITHTEGVVSVTPARNDAETYVDQERILDTKLLRHGSVLRFGSQLFRFQDPYNEERHLKRAMSEEGPPPYNNGPQNSHQEDPSNADMTFQDGNMNEPPPPEDILPATLEFREEGEDAFLANIISEVNGNNVQFKLAPTYTLYMATRFRISMAYRPEMSPYERAHRLTQLCNKVANITLQTVQEHHTNAPQLAFWMANASELLHFYKQDMDIGRFSLDAQDQLAEAVQVAFRYLVACMQHELLNCMTSFLQDNDTDREEDDEVLNVLSSTMSLLRKCRVNAALTIQLFSQLFHYINMWLFNNLVLEPRSGLCTRLWGQRLRRRLARVEIWAEKQGLELAADCHLARIIQATHLLQTPKATRDDITNISSTCFKLNSLQLRALLQNYRPENGEPHIPQELFDNVVAVAESTADELTRSDGRDVRLDEEPDLQLPFLLPEDGYSCDIFHGVPAGLNEFLQHLSQTGICRMTVQPMSSGSWTIYMTPQDSAENLRAVQSEQAPKEFTSHPAQQRGNAPPHPEVSEVTFSKHNGSLGLSIVAAKGEGQEKRGIYIKAVVPGGGAAMDGRLQAGDQLIEVDGHSLVGLSQEKAAEILTRTGQIVTLKVSKQGAIYHGLATMINQPSPNMQRANQGRGPPGISGPPRSPSRPQGEDVSRFGGTLEGSPRHPNQTRDYPTYSGVQKPINKQLGAQSSPALSSSRSNEQLRNADPYSSYKQPSTPMSSSYYNLQEREKPQPASRSKSTSQLDEAPMEQHSRMMSPSAAQGGNQQPYGPASGMFDMNRPLSQPDLQHPYRHDPRSDYENYPNRAVSPGQGKRSDDMRSPYNQHPSQPGMAKSTPNMYEAEHEKKDGPNPGQPRSEDVSHSRIHEWQKRNEMEQALDQYMSPSQMSRPGLDQYGSPAQQPPPQPSGPAPYQPGQPYQSPYYQGPKGLTPKPTSRPEPGMRLQDDGVPEQAIRPQELGIRQEQAMRPKDQPRSGQSPYRPGQYGQNSAHASPLTPGQISNQQPGSTPTSRFSDWSAKGRDQMHDRPPAGVRQDPYDRHNRSPDGFPPPPDMPPDVPPPPPPEDIRSPYGEEQLPPPPPPPTEYERQMQDEQERMKRLSGFDARSPAGIDPSKRDDFNRPGAYGGARGGAGQPPHVTSPYQQSHTPMVSQPQPGNYQNLSSFPGNRGRDQRSPSQMDSIQRPPPAASSGPPKPPVAAKPKFVPRPSDVQVSPWERDAKENERKQREEEILKLRDLEINDLESKPYLTKEEEERLRRLRLEQEFQRRVLETEGKDEDDVGDSDTDITDKASGRVQVLRMMRNDLERKRLKSEEERHQRELELSRADQEKVERDQRRLAQFEQERQEQREKEARRMEARERQSEEYFRKQRELRERQRLDQEEHRRQVQADEERRKELQKEELRKKKEMERDSIREIQLAQEHEGIPLRRPEDDFSKGRYPHTSMPSGAPYSQPPPIPSSQPPQSAPAPPMRGSSFDAANQHRQGPGDMDLPRSSSGGPFKQPDRMNDPYAAKKSVSFDNNIATEIREMSRLGSASSTDSYVDANKNNDTDYLFQKMSQPAPVQTTNPQKSQYQPPASQHQPPTSQYNQPPISHYNQPPTSQYQPPSSQYQAPTLQYQPPTSQFEPPTMYRGMQDQPKNSFKDHQEPAPNQPNYPYRGNVVESRPSAAQQPPPQPSYPYRPSDSQPSHSSAPYSTLGYNQGPPPHIAPPSMKNNEDYNGMRTPENRPPQASPQLVAGPTPGVVGAQEIYNDPRERIAAKKQALALPRNPGPERLSFRDKMRMFAKEAGENTPPTDKQKISRKQWEIENGITGQSQA